MSILATSTITVRSKNAKLVNVAIEIIEAEHPVTLRQLFYLCVSAGHIQNSQKEYKRLGGLMTRLREAGDIPRTWIVDHIRSRIKPSSWSGLADFADSVRSCYRRDFWESLPVHIDVIVEKDAVAGTVQPVTEEYDVAVYPVRGYSSVSFAGEIADVWQRSKKPVFAYYLGDFDPSGFDLERDLREKLARYSGRTWMSHKEGASKNTFVWQRLGVNQEDFDLLDLIKLPLKMTDKRTPKFRERWGDFAAELDAIPPDELRRRVRDAIESHIDMERWDRLKLVEEAEQETLDRVVLQLREAS